MRKTILGMVLRGAVVVAGLSLAVVVAMGDVIRLRDGSILRGKVISYSQRKFTIEVYIGGGVTRHTVSVDDVESVEFEGGSGGTVSQSVASPPAGRPSSGGQPAASGGREAATGGGAEVAATNTVIVEKTVTVAAAADWTSTEIRVQRGQRIVISASGEVDLGEGQRTGPAGKSVADSKKLMAAGATGGLIAVIGDDNDDFVFIGESSEFTAPHSGILFLSLNEGNLRDNSGSYVARVKVLSNR